MTHLIDPDSALSVWIGASVAIFGILIVVVAALWIRGRRPPRTALGWLGAWVTLHLAPLVGSVWILVMLFLSMRGYVARRTPNTPNL